jgi:hypothetical protein
MRTKSWEVMIVKQIRRTKCLRAGHVLPMMRSPDEKARAVVG